MPYLIVAVVVVIFIAVVFIVAGKDSKERIDMVSKLTEEQRNILMSTEVNFVEKNAWVQKANEDFSTICDGIKKEIDKGVFLVERKDETDLSVFEEKYGYRWRSGR